MGGDLWVNFWWCGVGKGEMKGYGRNAPRSLRQLNRVLRSMEVEPPPNGLGGLMDDEPPRAAAAPPGRVVIVGASAAGLGVAEGLRRLGFAGLLTLVGDEIHLPYDRPPLSKQLLAGGCEAGQLRLRSPEALDALDVELRLGIRAAALDAAARHVVLADGVRIGYDAVVVATGLSARWLPGSRGVAGVHVLRTVEDALALRASLRGTPRLVVVGSGFVAAEAAAVAREAGVRTTLVTGSPAPMAGVHREHGVRVETGSRVRAVLSGAGRATGVELADGRAIAADVVLLGVGAVPNTGWLSGSGVPVGDGVECDATLYAGQGVWAAGDVASWTDPRTGWRARLGHRTNAAEQGFAVARNVLAASGEAAAFSSIPFAWSDQYDLRLQLYGRTRGADRVRIVEGSPQERKLVAVYGSGGRVCGVAGLNMLRQTRGYRKLVSENAAWHSVQAAHSPSQAAMPASAGNQP